MRNWGWAAALIALTIAILALAGSIAAGSWALAAFGSSGQSGAGGWVYEYQQLLAGLLAVLVGGFTIWLLWLQIRDARVNSAEVRRVNIATSNRQLVAILDIATRTLNEGISMFVDGVGGRPISEGLPRNLGTELGLIDALAAAIDNARTAGMTSRFDPATGDVEVELGTELDRVDPAQALVDLMGHIARLLARGWSTLELSRRTAQEIRTLEDPPI